MTPHSSRPADAAQTFDAASVVTRHPTLDGLPSGKTAAELEQPNLSGFARQVDRALAAQRPLAIAFVRRWRRKYPQATPAELLPIAEAWFRRTAMGTGGGVGAAAVVPGIGTATGIAIAAAEVVSFIELTALYAMTTAEIHGDATDDPQRARTLVMALLLGDRGKRIIQEVAAGQGAQGLFKSAVWGELVTRALPDAALNEVGRQLQDALLKRFHHQQLSGMVGKVLPFGVGAAVGALGNRTLANDVITTAKTAFGTPPAYFAGPVSDETLSAIAAERDEQLIARAEKRAARREQAALRAGQKRAHKDAARDQRRQQRGRALPSRSRTRHE